MAEEKTFKWVRSIFGSGEDAAKKYHFIPDGGMNEVLKNWHAKQDPREWKVASPSRITACPRMIWLKLHGVPSTNETGWGIQQRLLLGRLFENQFAEQLKDAGLLLYAWKDDPGEEKKSLSMGEGLEYIEGTPDYLLNLKDVPTVSDAKTSRSDSFGYVPITEPEIWDDWGWYKYKVQLNAYYAICLNNEAFFQEHNLPQPEQCHLFSYALDDGIVRREFVWTPTQADLNDVRNYTVRFNEAVKSPTLPPCTCAETYDGFDVKFCDYGILEKNEKTGKMNKIASSCCSEELANAVNSN